MEDPQPDEKIIRAVTAGCEFFDRSDIRIHGMKLEEIPTDPVTLHGRTYTTEKVLTEDPSGDDLWARFYALDSSYDVISGAPGTITGTYPAVLQPVWCDVGCIYCSTYNEISRERRGGYDYLILTGDSLLEDYEAWKASVLKDTGDPS